MFQQILPVCILIVTELPCTDVCGNLLLKGSIYYPPLIFSSFFLCISALSREERLARDLEQVPKRRRASADEREEEQPRELGRALTNDDGKYVPC